MKSFSDVSLFYKTVFSAPASAVFIFVFALRFYSSLLLLLQLDDSNCFSFLYMLKVSCELLDSFNFQLSTCFKCFYTGVRPVCEVISLHLRRREFLARALNISCAACARGSCLMGRPSGRPPTDRERCDLFSMTTRGRLLEGATTTGAECSCIR